MTRGIDTYKLPIMDNDNLKAFHRSYSSCDCAEANNYTKWPTYKVNNESSKVNLCSASVEPDCSVDE